MNKKYLIFIALLILLVTVSCKEEDEFDYPLVFTGDVTNITDTSATFAAQVSNVGKSPIIESGFVWGVHSQDNDGIKIINGKNGKGCYSSQTNEKLLPGKTYYVRAYVQTESVVTYGREMTFKSPGEGTVSTGAWTQQYSDNPGYGWTEFIRSSFTINGTTFFAFENKGTLYSYNPTSNTIKYELTNSILSTADLSEVYNGKAYIFSKNAFYLFDPETKSLTRLSVLNENVSEYKVSGFLIDDNIYVGLGVDSSNVYSSDFWKYNITKNTWQQIASFPGESRTGYFSFSINKTGYVGGGTNLTKEHEGWSWTKYNDLWRYIPETDKWIQKEQIPIGVEDYLYNALGTSMGNFGYCLYTNKFHEYNPIFDIWEKMADLPVDAYGTHLFAVNDKIFLVSVTTNYLDEKGFNIWVYEK